RGRPGRRGCCRRSAGAARSRAGLRCRARPEDTLGPGAAGYAGPGPAPPEGVPLAVTPSAQYSITLRVEMDSTQADLLGQLTTAIGAVGGDIGAIALVGTGYRSVIRELVVNASDQEHADAIVAAAEGLDGVKVVSSF